jgi:hypothetical protein
MKKENWTNGNNKESIKKFMGEFEKNSADADKLEEVALDIISKYEIKDRKDKNRKWGKISEGMSEDYQSALSLAVSRILRKIKKQSK